MKKLVLFPLILSSALGFSQTRVSLYEEFTGEECPPCAIVNPGLNYKLNSPQNAGKVIAIKWQVPIPTAPFNSWSLYKTNQQEINWRYRDVASGGYGYPSSIYTPTADYVNHAPTGMIDGQEMNAFGLNSANPGDLTDVTIANAQSVPTNFAIAMDTQWNPSLSNCVVTVTVSSSSAFNSAGNLMFRLCLIEKYIEFLTPPGSNEEKEFYGAVRKSYPNTLSGGNVVNSGTLLQSSWSAGQSFTFSVNCPIPAYIVDKSQMSFVGFIQDDGNKKIYQAFGSASPSVPNDAKVVSVSVPPIICTPGFTPTVTVKNNGPVNITNFTITPRIDVVNQTDFVWSGMLSPGNTVTITLPGYSSTSGTHTFSCKIIGVSGGDIITGNNYREAVFISSPSFPMQQINESFEGTFPLPGWTLINTGTSYNFYKNHFGGGYGLSYNSIAYPLSYAPVDEKDEIILPPINISGINSPEFKFDLAYRQQNVSSNDSINVFISTDCGANWGKIYANGGAAMATAPMPTVASSFNPQSNEWVSPVISLASYTTNPDILIKMQIVTGGGNGLLIDNVNLGEGVPAGIVKNSSAAAEVKLFPNPAKDKVALISDKLVGAEVSITNIVGEHIDIPIIESSPGKIEFNCSSVKKGIYIVKVNIGNSVKATKLIISD